MDHTNKCTYEYHHIAQSIQDLSDNTQQNMLLKRMRHHSQMIMRPLVTSISQINILSQKRQMIPTFLAKLNNLAFTLNENTCTETLLANQTYSTMISTMKIDLHLQINM